jgi:hypothetical protein
MLEALRDMTPDQLQPPSGVRPGVRSPTQGCVTFTDAVNEPLVVPLSAAHVTVTVARSAKARTGRSSRTVSILAVIVEAGAILFTGHASSMVARDTDS